MFSVKTENILLNYFILLFTVCVLFLEHFSPLLFILLFIFMFSGILLFFDKYFFFKLLFLFGILLTIFFLFSLPTLNILYLLILFVAISQICSSCAYFFLLPLFYLYFNFFEAYLLISIFILILVFTFFFGIKRLNKEFHRKLFSKEVEYNFLRHDISNLCTIVFFKNKDKSLEPILEEMRLNLHPETNSLKISVAGLLRASVYLLEYDFNLKIKDNFFLLGDNLSWICFFYYLLENYAKKGSTIVVVKDSVFVALKKGDRKELDEFLANHFVRESVEIKDNVLKFNYGM